MPYYSSLIRLLWHPHAHSSTLLPLIAVSVPVIVEMRRNVNGPIVVTVPHVDPPAVVMPAVVVGIPTWIPLVGMAYGIIAIVGCSIRVVLRIPCVVIIVVGVWVCWCGVVAHSSPPEPTLLEDKTCPCVR